MEIDLLKRIKDPALQFAISETIRVMEMLSPENAERVIGELEDLYPDLEAIENYLINPPQIYFDPGHEIPPNIINKVIKSEGIINTEYVEMPIVARNKDGKGVLSLNKRTILPLYVRSNQQISLKESKAASENVTRNALGQVSGKAAKSGAFTDSELTITIGHNLNNVMKELMGPASHDLVGKKEMKQSIIKTGEVSLKDLTDNSKNKKSLLYFAQVLRSLDIDTDLVENPQRW